MIVSEALILSVVANSSSASSRCSPARRDAYQTQRMNVTLAAKSSPGVRTDIEVVYFRPPPAKLDGAASGRSCGSDAATRFSIRHTSSGGSSTENTVATESEWLPGGLLKFVNDAAASTEFGMICKPPPVSICVARQLTSTTRPRAVGVSIQSPI